MIGGGKTEKILFEKRKLKVSMVDLDLLDTFGESCHG